ncbi:MAG: heavy metal translocating P-type ATPase, partial [Gammaproteobacteria bacterium]|nr:heavy metal translocating P-type ATPase [Gammaproteobacteria bacterium]
MPKDNNQENIGSKTCYHCGLPVPPGFSSNVAINDVQQPMCCEGCEAVASAIIKYGLSDFYKHRTQNNQTGQELVPDILKQAVYYDNPKIQKSFVRIEEGDIREASLILEGITCAACIWLNEHYIASLKGVEDIQINYSTHRARVRWDESQLHLSDILQAISRIGYVAHPYDADRQHNLLEKERKQHLRRLGLAGVLGMQVMVIAVALYVGDWRGMEQDFRHFFYWLSLGLTLPVIIYSAKPFFSAAWRSLNNFSVGMDVPVSLGILIAFSAS